MPTDLYKGVLFHEGEGADVVDFNNLRGYLDARMFDQLLRAAVGSARSDGTGSTPLKTNIGTIVGQAPHLYALTGGAGGIKSGASNLQTSCTAGTIFQQVGSPAGDAATFIPYTLTETEFTLTHAAADPTNPRVDVIEVKLEYVDGNSESRVIADPPPATGTSILSRDKKRRVQATFQIKQGTPAASPAYPTLTAGYAAFGAVLIPATHAVGFDITLLRDLRIPIGVKQVDVFPSQFVIGSGFAWSQTENSGSRLQRFFLSGGSGAFSAPFPLEGTARIVGVQINGRFDGGTTTVALVHQAVTQAGFPETSTITSLGSTTVTNGARIERHILMDAGIGDMLAAGPSPAKNAEGIGDGLWGNGRYCGRVSDSGINRLLLDFASTAVTDVDIVCIRWFYADGIV